MKVEFISSHLFRCTYLVTFIYQVKTIIEYYFILRPVIRGHFRPVLRAQSGPVLPAKIRPVLRARFRPVLRAHFGPVLRARARFTGLSKIKLKVRAYENNF